MTLTQKQSELWQLCSTANTILAEGGGRSGKTVCFMSYIVARSLRYGDTDHMVGRLRFAHAKQSICFQTMQKLAALDNVNYDNYLNKTDWFYRFPNNSRIWIAGFDSKERVEKILGNEYATIYLNEASEIPYDTRETVMTRLNPPPSVPGKELIDYNPPSINHWGYKIFHKRVFPDGRPVPEDDYKWIKMNPVDNPHVSEQYLNTLNQMSAAKRLRFKDGEYGTDSGSLWKRAWITYDNTKRRYRRIVIGVDPSGSTEGDEIGIVAAGELEGDEYRVLDDESCHGTPAEWSAVVAALYKKWDADLVVAEKNYGGDMVAHTIQTAHKNINVKLVTSSRGKLLRAEPISALYEHGRVKHLMPFYDLEDEYCIYDGTQQSPNHMDAAVFALTELSGHSTPVLDDEQRAQMAARRGR